MPIIHIQRNILHTWLLGASSDGLLGKLLSSQCCILIKTVLKTPCKCTKTNSIIQTMGE